MAIRYYTTDSDSVIYYAATNAQGDVLALYTGGGIQSVTYEYDSWGNLISMSDTTATGIGSINPIRYRGYYFDSETGLYYLQSRYYDPQVGRFINADGYVSTGQGVLGNNMFAYCDNNPVNNSDPLGLWTIGLYKTFGIILCTGVCVSWGPVIDDNGNIDWQYSYALPGIDDTMVIGGFSIGGGVSLQYTNADTVYDLIGSSSYVGFSGGDGLALGIDGISFSKINESDADFDGFQVLFGAGAGVDFHIVNSKTRSFNKIERIYKPAPSSNIFGSNRNYAVKEVK